MKTYKSILFDLDNTLLDYDAAAESALRNTLEEHQIEDEFLSVYRSYKAINAELWKQMEQKQVTVSELRVERFRRLGNTRGWTHIDWPEFSEHYLGYLSRECPMYTGTEEVLSQLSENFTLGILTNGIPEVQRKRLKLSGLNQYFDAVIISGEHDISKPDPRIFEISINALNTSRESILYVGDSITSDMAGAQASGIDFCWFAPPEIEPESDYVYRYRIRQIAELIGILAD